MVLPGHRMLTVVCVPALPCVYPEVSLVCGMASDTIRKLVRLFIEPDRKRVMIPELYWDVVMQA